MSVAAIIAAGGRGERVGSSVPKQLLEIGGRPILQRALEAFERSPLVDDIITVIPPEWIERPPPFLLGGPKPARLVAGGARRQDSVANGFDALAETAELIVIHDGARPFVTPELIARTLDAARETGAAVAALPAHDTVKQARFVEGTPVVSATLPRESIFLAQTPQAFSRRVLRDAIARGRAGAIATDEAALAELAGHPVRLVAGDPANIKITSPEDLALAHGLTTAIREGGESLASRIGVGYDLHPLVDGRPLILGGVEIPFALGLAGHSDADALCHAVTDAILGAAGCGNIGSHFPDTDPRWRGASSIDLLSRAGAIAGAAGFAVENIDAVVICDRPKLAPLVDEMRRNLAGALGVDPAQISVKGKTNEGVGELGRGEAIAVHAVALLRKRF